MLDNSLVSRLFKKVIAPRYIGGGNYKNLGEARARPGLSVIAGRSARLFERLGLVNVLAKRRKLGVQISSSALAEVAE
jgi:hypothetical protein